MDYNGITAEGRVLLAENRFNNSKAFYEDNKQRIKELTTVPARQLAAAVSDTLVKIDPLMNLIPEKMVSRVRRDTRFSKDKLLYRENMWIMFMRPKASWEFQPCMWFEFYPDRYHYGVGMFNVTPSYMNTFRRCLSEKPDEFRSAVKKLKRTGAVPRIEPFKKEKPGDIPEDLKPYYNAKYLCFMFTGTDLDRLCDNRIVEDLNKAVKAFAPMYNFLLEVMERFISEQ